MKVVTITLEQVLQTALMHHQAGQFAEAETLYRQILAVQPSHPDALHLLGVIAYQVGQHEAAVGLIARAIAERPDDAAFHSNLGNAFAGRGSHDEAIACFQRALALRPDFAEPVFNLGNSLQHQNRLDEALLCFRQALLTRPDYPEALNNMGNALAKQGQPDEAIGLYRHAVALAPDEPSYHSNLVFALHFQPNGDMEAADVELSRWYRRHAVPRRRFIRPHHNDPDPDRRLKIGYVSPDLREHPVGRFLLPLLENQDHEAFTSVCYAEVAHPDHFTARMRLCADEWRETSGLREERLAERIREDGIDVLVDLALHTAGNRLPLFARKPAPVQVTYLAYPGTSGLEAMDYRLTDPFLDPLGMDDEHYSEVSVRLPQTYWCYQAPEEATAVTSLPALSTGHVTFGCLNNFSKVNARVLATWAKLLREVPNSRLLLHTREGSHRDQVREVMGANGIAEDRLSFIGFVPSSEYYGLYQQIDIALDTTPYAGGTTTCDALWMGVPVVSLVGETAVGRGGLSILSNVGLPELAARTEEEYVRIAVELANDLPRLAELRATMRERMQSSPLMDAPRFARNIEDAYRNMWRTWCATRCGLPRIY